MIIKGMNKELMLTFEFVTFFHRGLPTFMPAVCQLQVSQKNNLISLVIPLMIMNCF